MKKLSIMLLTVFTVGIAIPSCVTVDKKCKKSYKRLKKMRKANPYMM